MDSSIRAAPESWGNKEDALRDVCGAWNLTVRTGWAFVEILSAAVKRYGRGQEEKMMFLSDVADQTHVSIKRLQNILSLAGNESALMAKEYELELGHGDALARLSDPEEAESYARLAAENSWSVAELRAAIQGGKGDDGLGMAIMLTLELEQNIQPDDLASRLITWIKNNYTLAHLEALHDWLNQDYAPQ